MSPQARGHLAGKREQDAGIFLGQLAVTAVADFRQFALGLGADPGAAVALFAEKAHFAKEVAGVEVGKHDFVAVLILDQYGHRAFDDVVEYVGMVAGVDDDALGRVTAAVAVLQKLVD